MTFVVLALVVLAFGAAASGLLAPNRPVGLGLGLAAAGIAGTLCAAGAWSVLSDTCLTPMRVEWLLPLGVVRLAVDGLSAWFLLVIGLVGVAASIYSWGYFNDAPTHGPVRAFGPLVCTMIAAMVLVVCAADAVLFLVGWELMSLSAFFLVGFHDQDAEARRGAWTYLVATHLATGLGVLPVFAAFVARTGSTAMEGFVGAFGVNETATCAAVFALGLVGFGTKAGFMPFHVWLPAAHPVAPSPVSALMSGVVIKTGVYGLLRLLSWLPELPVGCAISLMTLSLVTGVMGILYALGQRQVERMLAYSSVENMGIIGVGISVAMSGRSLHEPALVALGFGGALLHVLNHALFKGLLFLSAGAVIRDAGTGDIERLGGLSRRTPVNALAFLIGSAAICALPPLNGFVSEFMVYTGILQGIVRLSSPFGALLAACAAVLALIGGLALVAFSKVFSTVFLGAPRDPSVHIRATPTSMKAGMMFLSLACVAVAVGSEAMIAPVLTALTPFAADVAGQAGAFRESLGILTRISAPLGALIVVGVGLFVVRRRMPAGGGVDRTWGCGYAFPATTMQYTGSSYAWKMIHSFRHLVRTERRGPTVAGCFPPRGRLTSEPVDWVEERIYRPMFTGLARRLERLWPLQHGRIQLYLVYIVATVLFVFLVEGWSTRSAALDRNGATMVETHGREVASGAGKNGE